MQSDRIFTSIVIIIMVFSGVSANGQIGVKAGSGVSDIVFSNEGQSPYLGYEVNYLTHRKPFIPFQAGAFTSFWPNNRFDLQPELLFVYQGLNYNMDFLYSDVIYKVNIYYLQVPMLARVRLLMQKKWHPVLYAGPYGSLKVRGTKITGEKQKGEAEKGIKKKETMENVRDGDFGLAFGVNFEIELSKNELDIDLRSSYSLINVMKPIDGYIPDYYGPTKGKSRNVSITLLVGYRFQDLW